MTQSGKGIQWGQLIRIIGTVVAVGLLVVLLARQDWADIWQGVIQIGWPRFLLAVALLLGSRVAISLRWYALLRGAGEKLSYLSSLRITFAGLFGNNFLPSTVGGDGIRLAAGIQAGWNGAVIAASLVMDRLVGMTGMATFVPVALPTLWANLSAQWSAGTALAAAAFPGDEPEQSPSKNIVGKIKAFLKRIWETIVLWARRPRTLVLPLLFTFIHMVFTFWMVWVVLWGMGDQLSFWQVGGYWALVYFITLLPISVGGLGLQEWAIWFTFTELGGIMEAHSLTLAFLFRTLMMLSSLPGAVFVPAILKGRQSED
jgi:uncharacterized membrane protein YbhN (UPF0104 family)